MAVDIFLFWVWSPLLLIFILSSAFGRTICWRGIRYKLVGPTETKVIGEKIINHLREMDHVAYVRFASVYRNFQDITEFVKEIEGITKKASEEASRNGKD